MFANKIVVKSKKNNSSLTITETSQWLYVELYEYAEKIMICDPHRNRLLSDGPKTDRIDAGKLCLILPPKSRQKEKEKILNYV